MSLFEELPVGVLTLSGASDGNVTVLEKDNVGKIARCKGTTVPAAAGSVYAKGCEFIKTDAGDGQTLKWVNVGSNTSCEFVPVSLVVPGYSFLIAGGPITSSGGDTTETLTVAGLRTEDISFVDHEVSDDSDQIAAQIAGENIITITGSADPATAHGYNYCALRDGCIPGYDVVAAGTAVTVGGAAAEDFTITGVVATDLAFACYSATDDTDTINKVVAGAGKITVTMSADPSTTHGLHYLVLRPRGTFIPSHYVAYAGVHTTVGGAAAEAITIAGALATDIAIVFYNTTDDTDTILKSVVTADTLTVTMSADPSTAHKLAYMVLREL